MAWNDPPSFNYQQLSNSDRKFKHRYVLNSKLGQPELQPQAQMPQTTMMNHYQPQQQPQVQYHHQPDQFQGNPISQFSDKPDPNNHVNNNLVLGLTNNFTNIGNNGSSSDNYATNGTQNPNPIMFPNHPMPASSFPYQPQQQQH